MDMFNEELASAQADEISKLKATIAEQHKTLRFMNNIYRTAWDVLAVVGCEGAHELTTECKLFNKLNDAMFEYDQHADLRDKYEPIERE